ncbi:unnamed protein product, partial [Rotaria sp. Silwood2]
MIITCSGSDYEGTFTIDGVYSFETHRMGLTQKYQQGTGYPIKNLGHQVTIQLTWNAQDDQFEGKYYVRTNKYKNEDKFQLKINRQQELSTYYIQEMP